VNAFDLQQTADGSFTLSRGNGKETYHSRFGAVTEARQVFLINSGVKERLEQQLPTSVLEIGFGTGLNFLLTALCARHNNAGLRYTGYENALLPSATITTLLERNTQGCEPEIAALGALTASAPTGAPEAINENTDLRLKAEDALSADLAIDQYHAIYLDAFSVSEAPEFWQTPFLTRLYNALRPQGRLATYSVNRPFKDALTQAGFQWQKLPGPAGKREVIFATRE